jgi:hypothetical protein
MQNRKSVCHFTGPATLFLRGGFGYRAVLVREFKVEIGPYAQHKAAVFVHYLEKGKRKWAGFVNQSPRGLIMSGHGYPNQADCMKAMGNGSSMTRHASFAPEWDVEFDAWAAVHLPAHKRLVTLANVIAENEAAQAQISEEEAHAATRG